MKKSWLFLLGILLPLLALQAHPAGEDDSEPTYRRVYIFNMGVGYNCPDLWGDGISSWVGGRDKERSGLAYSSQLITYTSHSSFGYGLYFYHTRTSRKMHDGLSSQEVGEKASLHYVAPQAALICRHTAFENCVGYVNAGVGYASYKNVGTLMQAHEYTTRASGVGCNVNIAYEYLFDIGVGIRISVDCIYARLTGLHDGKSSYPAALSVRPREKLHLFMPSLELGLSYCLFRD